MSIKVPRLQLGLLCGILLSAGGPACAQLYHTLSVRAAQIGFASNSIANFSLTPRYTIGSSNWQAEMACELPLKAMTSGEQWSGVALRNGEHVEINRYVAKIRLKSQPQEGNLGIVYATVNIYVLDIHYKYEPVFGDIAHNTTLTIASYGAGLFAFHELNASPFNLLGAELLLLTNFDTIEAVLEVKTLVMRNWKLGIVLEALQPKPRFTDLYVGTYLEYSFRW